MSLTAVENEQSILSFKSKYILVKIFKFSSVPKCLTLLCKSFKPTDIALLSMSLTSGVNGSVMTGVAPYFKLISST